MLEPLKPPDLLFHHDPLNRDNLGTIVNECRGHSVTANARERVHKHFDIGMYGCNRVLNLHRIVWMRYIIDLFFVTHKFEAWRINTHDPFPIAIHFFYTILQTIMQAL